MNLDENLFYKKILMRIRKELPAGSGTAGPKGDTGATGAAGSTGGVGAAGVQGPIGNTGAQGPQGVTGPAGLQGPAGVSGLQAIRAQTTAAGAYTWTFSTPFAAGVMPVISLTAEDSTTGALTGVRITALSNASVTILASRSAGVTVAGIAVLGAAVGVQINVHLHAVAPT